MTARKCPRCGSTDVEVVKTWNLVSPLPDRMGRVTLTVMGRFKCSSCGYSWSGVVSKIKVGGRAIEAETEKGTIKLEEEEKEPPKEIVIDIEDILEEEQK